MCLGIPGKVQDLYHAMGGQLFGRVEFGGVLKEVCMTFVPDAEVGNYVIVHAGFALSKIDEKEAERVFEYLEEIGELEELNSGEPEEPEPAGD